MNLQLKSCPCCGGFVTVSDGVENSGWNDPFYVVRIKCEDYRNCGVQLEMVDRPGSYEDNLKVLEKAVTAWNRRV